MRGYFGVGVEGISKARNVGSLFRTAHAFGASFMFTVGGAYTRIEGNQTDTSQAARHIPFYDFPDLPSMVLPGECTLVGIELTDNAIELPSFRHPIRAAYVLGPEKGSVSEALRARCAYIIKIPTRFCINVGLAGAVVMYDRTISMGRFAARAAQSGGPTETLEPHKHGGRFSRKKMQPFEADPPLTDVNMAD